MTWTRPTGADSLTPEQAQTLEFFSYSQSDDLLIASKDLRIPSASLNIEDLITLSEQTGFLSLFNNVTGLQFTFLDSLSTAAVGSFRPKNFFLNEPENNLVLQSDFSVPIATADFVFNITTTVQAQTNKLNLMTSGAINNLRIKIVDTVSGVAFKYIPNRLAFESGLGGIDVGTGTVPIDLGISPLRFDPGRELTITVNADSDGILGSATGIPWLSADLQRAEDRFLVWDHQVDWRKIDDTSTADELVIKKGEHLLIDSSVAQIDLTVDLSEAENSNWYSYIMDFSDTFGNNDTTINLGTDTFIFSPGAKSSVSVLIRSDNKVRVYDGLGKFKVEGNI